MDEPERCPFCKATEGLHITILPTVSFGKEVSVEESWKAVKCHTCGATGPMAKSPKEAEHLWNTRHTHDQIKEVIDLLKEARAQIEYLHGKFQATGTGNAVIARLDKALEGKEG